MRSRALALMTATAVAATPAAVVVTSAASAKTKTHHAGEACNYTKKAPTGFVCVKNSKGKYVLAKKK